MLFNKNLSILNKSINQSFRNSSTKNQTSPQEGAFATFAKFTWKNKRFTIPLYIAFITLSFYTLPIEVQRPDIIARYRLSNSK